MKIFYLFLFAVLSCQSYTAVRKKDTYLPDTLNSALNDTQINSVYLTWDSTETSSTMVVNYLALQAAKFPTIYFEQESRAGDSERYAEKLPATERIISGTPFHVYSFSLKNLNPNSAYYFIVGDELNGFTKELRFRTLPADDTPVEFIQGGDMSTDEVISKIASHAVTNNTRAILIGGDLAYVNGNKSAYKKWLDWFEQMNLSSITPDGHLIPLILAIGNHETNHFSAKQPLNRAPFYFSLFPQSDIKPNFTRQLGNHSVVYVLDSGHILDHDDQVNWLEKEMKADQNRSNRFALYHVPLYPTHRDFDGKLSEQGRKYWLPLFDKYNLTLAFENHDHALKRTKPLRNNSVSNEGTIFLGDGCWGVGKRKIHRKWYHQTADSEQHVWRINTSKQVIEGQAIGKHGEILDQLRLTR